MGGVLNSFGNFSGTGSGGGGGAPTPDISYYRKTGSDTIERWYSSWISYTTPTSTVQNRSQLRSIPFIVSKTITLDRIGMEITTGGSAGSLVRLGIYASTNSIPDALVLDAGTIAGDSATFQSIVINQTLTAGLYWLTSIHNSLASITFRAYNAAGIPAVLGVPSALGNTAPATQYSSVFVYDVLPANYDYSSFAANVISPPIISVRLSA
jgi:hypothetical protein